MNECEIVDDVCGAGECRNTEGSFTCHCKPGHMADDFTKVCVGKCLKTIAIFTQILLDGQTFGIKKLSK